MQSIKCPQCGNEMSISLSDLMNKAAVIGCKSCGLKIVSSGNRGISQAIDKAVSRVRVQGIKPHKSIKNLPKK